MSLDEYTGEGTRPMLKESLKEAALSRAVVSLKTGQVYFGDCKEVLKTFPDSCIDLIVTSPPYADNRKTTYGGIPTAKYVEWFTPISAELKRVLKPDGSFILNVKERVVNGER